MLTLLATTFSQVSPNICDGISDLKGVRTVASNSTKLAKTRHESVVTNTHAWDMWAGSEWRVRKRVVTECYPRYHHMAMSTRGGVTAAVRRGSPSLRAPFRSYRRTLSGARLSLLGNPSGCRGRRLLPETLLGAGTGAPSETLLGAEGQGVTLPSCQQAVALRTAL